MTPYRHRVQYYETDRMGIVHHSNYIRWMEEARIALLAEIGFPYEALEARGVVSPVRSVQCRYLRSCTFGDDIEITASVRDFNGVVLTLAYDMRRAGEDETLCRAESEHVFLNREGRFIRMKRDLPDFCAALEALASGGEDAK